MNQIAQSQCLDIRPPQAIGLLSIGQAVPEAFVKKYKPAANKEAPSWYKAKASNYRVVDNKVSIVEFTPAEFGDCVTLNGKTLNKKLSFAQYGKLDQGCRLAQPKDGGSSYLCAGYSIQESSALSQWPHPYFRIDEVILKNI